MTRKKVDSTSFWKWFQANEALIRVVLDDEQHEQRAEIIELLNNYILDFGMFSWEIGETKSNEHYLIISPNGNAELLHVSRKVIAAAPQVPGWEFHFAKPAKDWNRTFTVYDELMELREVNASDWKFKIEKGAGQKIHLHILAESIISLDPDTRERAADIFITGELGEENRIRIVEKIHIANADDAAFAEIQSLQKVIASFG